MNKLRGAAVAAWMWVVGVEERLHAAGDRVAERVGRRRVIAISFAVVALLGVSGNWRAESAANEATSAASEAKATAGRADTLAKRADRQQQQLEDEIASRRVEREAQIKALDAAVAEACESRHIISDVLGGILRQSRSNAETDPSTLIPDLTPAQLRYFEAQQARGIAQLDRAIAATEKADCDSTGKPASSGGQVSPDG